MDTEQREALSPYNCGLHRHFCDLDSTRCTPSLAGGYSCECRQGFVRSGSQTSCVAAPEPAITASPVKLTEPTAMDVPKSRRKRSWIVAIPLVFETGCTDTNLSPDRVERLNARRQTMMEQLDQFGLDAQPAEFCRQEALEDDRPLCKGTPLRDRVDNATKTLNLAKNLRNAFLMCKNSGYKLCLIMEDDTVLHPNFHEEAKKTLASLETEGFKMGLLHLCPQMLHRTVHPEKGEPVRRTSLLLLYTRLNLTVAAAGLDTAS